MEAWPWLILLTPADLIGLSSVITGLKVEKDFGTSLGLVPSIVLELPSVPLLKVDMEMCLEPGEVGLDVGLRL